LHHSGTVGERADDTVVVQRRLHTQKKVVRRGKGDTRLQKLADIIGVVFVGKALVATDIGAAVKVHHQRGGPIAVRQINIEQLPFLIPIGHIDSELRADTGQFDGGLAEYQVQLWAGPGRGVVAIPVVTGNEKEKEDENTWGEIFHTFISEQSMPSAASYSAREP
jgi:hypothetical protein